MLELHDLDGNLVVVMFAHIAVVEIAENGTHILMSSGRLVTVREPIEDVRYMIWQKVGQ